MKTGYMYILLCGDGSYYTGSTTNLTLRIAQHQSGEGSNHTKKHLPVQLVYFEKFDRISDAFNREKQIQGWRRKKKQALINASQNLLPLISKNHTQYPLPNQERSAKFSKVASKLVSTVVSTVVSTGSTTIGQ